MADVAANKRDSGYRQLLDRVTRWLSYVGIVFLMGMMLASVIDVTGRTLLNKPLPGSYELVQYALIGTVFFCFGHIQMMGGNISVEVAVDRMPRRAQAVLQLITTAIGVVMFVYFSWASIQQGLDVHGYGAASGVLGIPDWPFTSMVAMGYIVLMLVLVSDLMKCVDELRQPGPA